MEFNPNKINEVGERLGRIWEEQKHMLETIEKEKRTFNAEEKAKYDAMESEFLKLDDHKRTLESAKKKEAALAEDREFLASENKISKDEQFAKENKSFEKFLRYGMQNLSQDERAGLKYESLLPGQTRGTNTQIESTTTLGGYTVPQEWTRKIDVAMQAIGAVDDVALVINTSKGGTLPYPKVDDTGVSGAIMSEGVAPAVSDMTFGITNLGDWTYTSYWIKVSLQLLNDEDVDLVSVIGVAAAERLRRGMNTDWTNGDGSNKPLGIVRTASEGKDGGDGGSLDANDLYDIKSALDPKYAANGKWMFSNATLTLIKKLSVGASDNRPLWVPSLRDGAPATIDGDPYVINQQMPAPTAGNKYILYGDFKGYAVRKTGGMNMIRTDERFIDALSVGFLGFQRTDSDKISAGTPYVYLYRTAT